MERKELIHEICELTNGIDAIEASKVLKALGTILREKPAEEAMKILGDLVKERD